MLLFALSLLLYFGLHSLLAAERIKAALTRLTGLSRMGYRRFYNLVALLTLAGLSALYLGLAPRLLWSPSGWLTAAGWLLMGFGLVVVYAAMRNYDLGEFIGTRAPQHTAGLGELKVTGLNRYVRHPLYLGIFLLLAGNLLRAGDMRDLMLAVIGIAYLYIGAGWEEEKLVATFGDDYRKYRQRVPKILPTLRNLASST